MVSNGFEQGIFLDWDLGFDSLICNRVLNLRLEI
jgi:hypothetical protein